MTAPLPSTTTPSKGITFPMRSTTWSPGLTFSVSTRTSLPSERSHTRLIFKDMLLARSSTDFLWVHSSKISPIPSKNITEPAVFISRRKRDTVMAVPSRTETPSLPCPRVLAPFQINLADRQQVTEHLTGMGRNSFSAMCSATFQMIFSW